MRACFRGLDRLPGCKAVQAMAIDRTARVTYVAYGWKATDPATRADIGSVPERAILMEARENVLRMSVRWYQQQEH